MKTVRSGARGRRNTPSVAEPPRAGPPEATANEGARGGTDRAQSPRPAWSTPPPPTCQIMKSRWTCTITDRRPPAAPPGCWGRSR
eukprot:258584-Pyramimonas_sp.AAC.1